MTIEERLEKLERELEELKKRDTDEVRAQRFILINNSISMICALPIC